MIENPVGTAPAFAVESERGVVISLPGVPREMKYLTSEAVLPYLLRKYDLGIIVARILRTAGIGESSLDDQIGMEILSETNPSVGLAAHHGCVDIRVTAKAASSDIASSMLDQMQARLEAQIGDHIFGIDDATLEDVVWQLVEEHKLTVHVIEAGIPGVISDSWAGDSNLLSATRYDNPQQLYNHYSVNEADVSLRECAIDVAQRDRVERGVDASIAVLSYPDLDENADIEQGSAIAICTAWNMRYRVYGFGTQSNLAREWLSRWGLANLWRMIKERYSD